MLVRTIRTEVLFQWRRNSLVFDLLLQKHRVSARSQPSCWRFFSSFYCRFLSSGSNRQQGVGDPLEVRGHSSESLHFVTLSRVTDGGRVSQFPLNSHRTGPDRPECLVPSHHAVQNRSEPHWSQHDAATSCPPAARLRPRPHILLSDDISMLS